MGYTQRSIRFSAPRVIMGLVVVAAWLVVLMVAALPDSHSPLPSPMAGLSSWYQVALDLEGLVPPHELLGGEPRSQELLDALAHENLSPAAFRRAGACIRERAIRHRRADPWQREIEDMLYDVELPVGVTPTRSSAAPPATALDPDRKTLLAFRLVGYLAITIRNK